MAELRITDENDVERATLPISDYTIRRDGFNIIPEAEVSVSRDFLNDVDALTPGEDHAYVVEGGEDTFGGIVRTPERQGGVAVLKIRGFAQYLVRARSVPTGQERVGVDDSDLINEVLDKTPELAAGKIETVESGQTYVFGGISQWEKAKKVANSAGGEIRVNADKTVDYKESLGSDKTGTSLSPENRSFVEDTFVVNRDGVHGNTTHLLVTGVGSGSSQIEVAIVPEDDSNAYSEFDRVETYSNPNWSDVDQAIWGNPRGSKDLKTSDAAATWGQTVMSELPNEEITVETVVKGADVALGDRFHISNPHEDVDDNLRAVKVVELLSPGGGKRYETTFSNYSVAHQDTGREDHKDTRDYTSGAYEGAINRINDSPGRGPVGPNHDYVMSIEYPDDVVSSLSEELQISGQCYRAYSSGAAGGGDHSHDIDFSTTSDSVGATMLTDYGGGSPSSNPVSDGDSFTAGPVTLPDSGQDEYPGSFLGFAATLEYADGETVQDADEWSVYMELDGQPMYDARVSPTTKDWTENQVIKVGTVYSYIIGDAAAGMSANAYFRNESGRDIDIASGRIHHSYSRAHLHTLSDTTTSDASGDHTHPPDPGIIDFDGADRGPALYPSNVDVEVNGTSQGFSLGDGGSGFEETVDIEGALTQGWNEIRLTSDSLGHLDATFSGDLFRQSL